MAAETFVPDDDLAVMPGTYGLGMLAACGALAARTGGAGVAYRSYWEMLRLAEAIPVLERTLGDRERALGADHPDTLDSRSDLGRDYLASGRHENAIPVYERMLGDRERVLGADHRTPSRHAKR